MLSREDVVENGGRGPIHEVVEIVVDRLSRDTGNGNERRILSVRISVLE